MANINTADLIKSASLLKERNTNEKIKKPNIFIKVPRLGKKLEFAEPPGDCIIDFFGTKAITAGLSEESTKIKVEESVCDLFLCSCTFNFNNANLKIELSDALEKKIITEHDALRHVLVFDEINSIVWKILEHYEVDNG